MIGRRAPSTHRFEAPAHGWDAPVPMIAMRIETDGYHEDPGATARL